MPRWSLGELELKDIAPIVKKRFNPDVFKPGSYWTILWVGRIYVTTDGNLEYEAVVTEIKDFESKGFNFKRLKFSNNQIISLPARLMRIIPPGTVIRDGVLLFKKHHKYFKKSKVKVLPNHYTTTLISLSEWEHYQYFRSAFEFRKLGRVLDPIGKKLDEFCAFSKVVIIQHFDYKKPSRNVVLTFPRPVIKEFIIFPCAELARFYWFTSTRMTQVLFTPGEVSKKNNKLWNPESVKFPDSENDHHYLHIRDEMYLRDAHVISRIAFSETASASAKYISESIVNRRLEGGDENSFFIKSDFPFQKSSDIKVLGIETNFGEIKIKLVLEILECSGEWPFTSLRYDRETEDTEEDLRKEIKGEKRSFIPRKEKANDPNPEDAEDKFEDGKYDPLFDRDNLSLEESQLNDRGTKNAVVIDRGKRFKALPQDIVRERRVKKIPPKKKLPPTPRFIKNISTNENKTGKQGSTGIDIGSDERREDNLDSKGTLSKLMKDMAKRFTELGASVRYHNLIDEFGQESFITIRLVPAEGYTKRQKSFTKTDDGNRRIIVQHVEHEESCFLVCELEPKKRNDKRRRTPLKVVTKMTGQEGSCKMSKKDAQMIILSLITSLGKLKNMKGYRIYSFKHGSRIGPKYADKILTKLKRSNSPEDKTNLNEG